MFGNIRSVIRKKLKSAAITGLNAYYRARLFEEQADRLDRVQFVNMHWIRPGEEDNFRSLAGLLKKDFRFISYSEAVRRVMSGEIDGRYMAFSVDDGLKSTIQIARILEEFGTVLCSFVCGDMLKARDRSVKERFCIEKAVAIEREVLSQEDVEALLKRGHEIGSHTMSHALISDLLEQQVVDEVAESYEFLSRELGAVRHFAWPYGRFHHFSDFAAKAVFEAGFESCASGERGCHITKPDSEEALCIRRDALEPNCPLSYTRYFMTTNATYPSRQQNGWPEGWGIDNG